MKAIILFIGVMLVITFLYNNCLEILMSCTLSIIILIYIFI
jgi:hypothetical protein